MKPLSFVARIKDPTLPDSWAAYEGEVIGEPATHLKITGAIATLNDNGWPIWAKTDDEHREFIVSLGEYHLIQESQDWDLVDEFGKAIALEGGVA